MGTYSGSDWKERRCLCCNERIVQLPEFGLWDWEIFRSRWDCSHVWRSHRPASQTQWGYANLLVPVGVLWFPDVLLWRKECGRSAFHQRIENGADGWIGSRLRLRYSWFGSGHGFRICRRKRSSLSSCYLEIYTDVAAQLYSQQSGDAFAGSQDEADSKPCDAAK